EHAAQDIQIHTVHKNLLQALKSDLLTVKQKDPKVTRQKANAPNQSGRLCVAVGVSSRHQRFT
ncbi:hypothetical protein, partial [Pseudomonas petroselini]|uniref:hypothetical protein n=1 Tax=Pseudomonas petroselini TaxID=2899822 RepID=UPI001E4AE7E3